MRLIHHLDSLRTLVTGLYIQAYTKSTNLAYTHSRENPEKSFMFIGFFPRKEVEETEDYLFSELQAHPNLHNPI